MQTLRAKINFLLGRNIRSIGVKELTEMAWETYQSNSPLVPAKDLIGETLEYLDHSIQPSKFNPTQRFAIIQCIHHKSDGIQRPVSVTANSSIILRWLNDRQIKGFFRFTYNPDGKTRWGIEVQIDNDQTDDDIPF